LSTSHAAFGTKLLLTQPLDFFQPHQRKIDLR
jgi:hypothetical protein